jgi:hypothetical protein
VYLLAEGFRHTKNPHKYLARLGAFALISEIPFDLAFRGSFSGINFFAHTNIFYTLLLGGAAVFAYTWLLKHVKTVPVVLHAVALLPTLVFMWLADFLTTDYGSYGVVFILLMYVIKNFKLRLVAMAFLCVWQQHELIIFIVNDSILRINNPFMYLLLIPATLVPVAFIARYNGNRGLDRISLPRLKYGINFKWLFYVFYPAHLLVLAVFTTIPMSWYS